MNDSVFLSQTKLASLGKKGEIKPDADGYYTMVLGGLECYNNTKSHYYTSQDVLHLFAAGSLLDRRIKQGVVRAEVGHPQMRANETMEQFIQRLADIDLNNTCAHIRKIWLDMDYGKNHPDCGNPNMIAIMGEVKPEGGRGFILEEALKNKHANIYFSVRSVSNQEYRYGRRVRQMTDIITFDLVNEGGIIAANKWDSPACESSDYILPVTREVIERARSNQKSYALESTASVIDTIHRRVVLSDSPSKKSVIERW